MSNLERTLDTMDLQLDRLKKSVAEIRSHAKPSWEIDEKDGIPVVEKDRWKVGNGNVYVTVVGRSLEGGKIAVMNTNGVVYDVALADFNERIPDTSY